MQQVQVDTAGTRPTAVGVHTAANDFMKLR